MIVGMGKFCPVCKKEVYVKIEDADTCSECKTRFDKQPEKKQAPSVIVYLGANELNRRQLMDIEKRGF